MEITKKPKRPRIGENQEINAENGHFEKVTYNPNSTNFNADQSNNISEGQSKESQSEYQERGYTQNNYRQQGSYNNNYRNNRFNNNRQQNNYNYNRQGGYNNYNNNRQQGGYNNNRQQGGYNNNYNNQQGGYNNYNNRQQGGYNNNYNNQQGGYNNYNSRQQGGYNNNRQQGGYNNYNNRQQQGGYNNYNNNRRQQGGYNNNRQQGGYNNYNNCQQGGFNNFKNNRQGNFNRQGGQRFTPRPQPVIYEMPEMDPNEEIRLNKFMANAGICSRREADDLIQKGLVKVNNEVVTELGTKIKREDIVEYDEKVVTLENKCYILLNKPKDCVTTSDDPDGRLTVMDLVKNACKERIYPVGRLDRNTTGVLLLTNDGDLASKLTHPKYVKKKIYQVWTDKNIAEEDMQRLADGIELEDGPIHADAISYVNDRDKNQAGIEIHSGRNRIVRRMFESLGYRVTKLDRVYFAGLTKKNLPRGRWRYLTQEEVNFLKQGSFE